MCRKNHENTGVNQYPNRQKDTTTNYDKLKQKYEFSASSTKKKLKRLTNLHQQRSSCSKDCGHENHEELVSLLKLWYLQGEPTRDQKGKRYCIKNMWSLYEHNNAMPLHYMMHQNLLAISIT